MALHLLSSWQLLFLLSVVQTELHWICYLSWRDDQVLTDVDPETGKVYLGQQFVGEVHHGGAAFGSGSSASTVRTQSEECVCSVLLLNGVSAQGMVPPVLG